VNVDTNSAAGLLVRYLSGPLAGTTVLASVNAAGTGPGNNHSDVTGAGRISADGRYLLFTSKASDLVSGFVNVNTGFNLYLRDLQQGLTKPVNSNQSGTASGNQDESAGLALLSADGSTVVFNSSASDLFAGDRNRADDVLAVPSAGFSTIRGQVFNDLDLSGTKN